MNSRHRWLAPLAILAVALAYASWFWPTLTFTDGDSFYHIKITELLARGIPRAFPWLPYTTLADSYIDHHFLYHLVLYPFVHWIGPFIGAKIATVLLAALVFVLFYCLCRAWQFRAPSLWVLLLALAPGFMFRMDLTKAPAFSLLFILAGVWLISRRRPVALGALAFFYVWGYNAWPLLLVVGSVWVLADALFPILMDGTRSIRTILVGLRHSPYARSWIGVAAGSALGLLVNPYFPTNLAFSWVHIVQIGLVNYQSKIGVGAEWYPPTFSYLFGSHALTFAVGVVAILLVLVRGYTLAARASAVPRDTLRLPFVLLMLAAVFFVMTLRSRRHLEYFFPFLTLAIGSFMTIGWPAWRTVYQAGIAFLNNRRNWFLVPALSLLLASVLFLSGDGILAHRRVLAEGYRPEAFSGITAWLTANTAPGDIIFHSRWDTFPMLFYGADQNRYINGLDSTFLYVRDPARYELWRTIVSGEYVGDLATVIPNSFGARTVFVDAEEDRAAFRRQLELARGVEQVYEDSAGTIFVIE